MNKKEDKGIKNISAKEEKNEYEIEEDCTKYGEFVSSYFAWLPLNEQKEKARKIENMTSNKSNFKEE